MTEKKKRGRLKNLVMPHRIPDTPENIAKACMQGPSKEEREYLSRWTDNPFGPVAKTPEERARIAKRDADLKEVGERLRKS